MFTPNFLHIEKATPYFRLGSALRQMNSFVFLKAFAEAKAKLKWEATMVTTTSPGKTDNDQLVYWYDCYWAAAIAIAPFAFGIVVTYFLIPIVWSHSGILTPYKIFLAWLTLSVDLLALFLAYFLEIVAAAIAVELKVGWDLGRMEQRYKLSLLVGVPAVLSVATTVVVLSLAL